MKKYVKASVEKFNANDILSLYGDVLPNVVYRLLEESDDIYSLIAPIQKFDSGNVDGSTTDLEDLKTAQSNIQFAYDALQKVIQYLDDWKHK